MKTRFLIAPLIALVASLSSCALNPLGSSRGTPPPKDYVAPIAIFTVEVEPKAAVVMFDGASDRLRGQHREMATRSDGTVVEEFRENELWNISARADGYITSTPVLRGMAAGQNPRLKIVLVRKD